MLFKILLAVVPLWLANNVYCIYANYKVARQIGLPIIICPITWQNPLWMLASLALPLRRISRLPGFEWIGYTYFGWVLYDTGRCHDRLGPAFTIVSLYKNEIITGDLNTISELMSQYKRWQRPEEVYSIFKVLGENVDTVNGDEWPRHRRIINAGFDEGNTAVVWDATVNQVQDWAKEQTLNLKQMNDTTEITSMNVLMRSVFGKEYSFNEKGLKDVKPGRQKSLVGAMRYIVENLFVGLVMMNMQLPSWMEPAKFRDFRKIGSELKSYFKDIIEERSGSLVQALVEANENEKAGGRVHLSQEELYGNLFVFQLAGHDTTSYTMFYTLALLSVHPEVQEWVRQGIAANGYHEGFPTAVRTRAALMETLRMYSPAPNLERISPHVETLTIAGKKYIIPADTFLASNFPRVHYDPTIWGDDSRAWKPSRWIEVVDGKETLKGALPVLAWSTGPRICPGKKFAQVEVTAAICTVLKDYRLEGTANMQEVLSDFRLELTPKPVKPESANIRFVKL